MYIQNMTAAAVDPNNRNKKVVFENWAPLHKQNKQLTSR